LLWPWESCKFVLSSWHISHHRHLTLHATHE
jgi:hypothetical protein